MGSQALRNYSTNCILAGHCRIRSQIKIAVHICGYSNRHSSIEEEEFMCSIVFNYLRNSYQITQLVLKKKCLKNKNPNSLKIRHLHLKMLKIKKKSNQRRIIIIMEKRTSRYNQQHNNSRFNNLLQLHSPQYPLQQSQKPKK